MKLKHMTLAAMLTGMAISAVHAAQELPGVPAQSDTYWAERALQAQRAQTTETAQRQQESDALYTGKPYDADSGTYTFMYRNYDPELGRWTSSDPSGFPDGANGQFYAPTPTSELDYFGLWVLQIEGDANTSQEGQSGFKDITGEDRTMDVLGRLNASVTSSSGTNGDTGTVQGYGRAMYTRSDFEPPNQLVFKNLTANFNVSMTVDGIISVQDGGGQYVGTTPEGLKIALQMNANVASDKRSVVIDLYVDGIYQGAGVNNANFNIGLGPVSVGGGLGWDSGKGETLIHVASVKFIAVE